MIKIIENCPSCAATLEKVNDQLFCKNLECPAQTIKGLQHYCKVMRIKGLGEKTLEKLDFQNIGDLYNFSESYYTQVLGESLGRKAYKEVQESKKVSLDVGLAAFSIPLIGETASKKLAGTCLSVEDITEASCKSAGLGAKATANLLFWLENSADFELPINWNFANSAAQANTISVCITGKLRDFKSRAQAQQYLESLGFTVVDSVTKTTTALIDEEGKRSSKRTKAETLNIPIISIEALIKGNK